MHDPDKTSRMINDTVENFSRTYQQYSKDNNSWEAIRKKAMEERLSKLDELSRSEFYRLRTHRKNNGVLSARDIDLLTLEAMEKSYKYRNEKQKSVIMVCLPGQLVGLALPVPSLAEGRMLYEYIRGIHGIADYRITDCFDSKLCEAP